MRLKGLWLGVIFGALLALPMVYASTATAGTGNDMRSWGQAYDVIVLDAAAYNEPMFALPVLVDRRYAVERDHPIFKPHVEKQRLQLAAVRATAVAGWRSGRVRALSFG